MCRPILVLTYSHQTTHRSMSHTTYITSTNLHNDFVITLVFIFIHFKLCVASARRNLTWVKISIYCKILLFSRLSFVSADTWKHSWIRIISVKDILQHSMSSWKCIITERGQRIGAYETYNKPILYDNMFTTKGVDVITCITYTYSIPYDNMYAKGGIDKIAYADEIHKEYTDSVKYSKAKLYNNIYHKEYHDNTAYTEVILYHYIYQNEYPENITYTEAILFYIIYHIIYHKEYAEASLSDIIYDTEGLDFHVLRIRDLDRDFWHWFSNCHCHSLVTVDNIQIVCDKNGENRSRGRVDD